MASSGNRFSQRRWFDKYDSICMALTNIQKLPLDFQAIVSAGVNVLIERVLDTDEKVKSVGKDKILSLHKSKNRNREYDKSPELHKTMNYLLILPDEGRESLGTQFQNIATTVVEYVDDCNATHQEPKAVEVEGMTQTFVDSGGSVEATRSYIIALHPEFIKLRKWPKPKEEVFEDDGGMKIRQSSL